MEFDKLEVVNQSRNDWNVKVRVTRMWPAIDINGNFLGFNLILLDSEDYHVHGFVNPDIWNSLQNVIAEGNVYLITNFTVVEATGNVRPVSSSICVMLTHLTVLQPIFDEVIDIAMHRFELVDLEELYNPTSNCIVINPPENVNVAIDIAGIITNMEYPRMIRTFLGDKQFLRFQIFDGRTYVKVTIWDGIIPALNTIMEHNIYTPNIVILTTMRARIFRGSLHISSSLNTRCYANIQYGPVNHICQRLIEQGY